MHIYAFFEQKSYTDRVGEEGNKIGRVRLSVSTLTLNRLTFDLDFCICTDHDHSSPVKVKGWVSKYDNAIGLSSKGRSR